MNCPARTCLAGIFVREVSNLGPSNRSVVIIEGHVGILCRHVGKIAIHVGITPNPRKISDPSLTEKAAERSEQPHSMVFVHSKTLRTPELPRTHMLSGFFVREVSTLGPSNRSVVIIEGHVGKNDVDVGILCRHVGKIAIHVGITLKWGKQASQLPRFLRL